MRVRVLPDLDAVAEMAAREIAEAAQRAITARGRFVLALAGGRTPALAYTQLGLDPWTEAVDWSRVEFCWGDERAVPPDHGESNYAMARRTLLRPLGIDESRVHRMRGEASDLDAAAREYETELTRLAGSPPVLDLILLGMGADGHVASLFPGSPALTETERLVLGVAGPETGRARLTLTFPTILASRQVLVQVSGPDKREAVHRALGLAGAVDEDVPARRLLDAGDRVLWLLDAAAAGDIHNEAGTTALDRSS
jgi:6-phosphogluconolactonase